MLLDFDKLYKMHNMHVTGVIHIGGHHGQEYKIYKKYPSIQSMIFFEPDPDSFKILQEETGDDDKVICINKGLGPFSCKAMMNREQANQGQSNSVLDPGIHLQQYPNIVFTDKLEIQLHPLDRYEPSKLLNMINIDVQGFELQVFLGASKVLENIRYIFTEVNRAEVYKNCALIEDLDYFLGKYNFDRVETSWDGQTWGDAFYIKK